MSTEFNPMDGLLADLLSTWDEEPIDGAEPAAEALTSSSPELPGEAPVVAEARALPAISALPLISALPKRAPVAEQVVADLPVAEPAVAEVPGSERPVTDLPLVEVPVTDPDGVEVAAVAPEAPTTAGEGAKEDSISPVPVVEVPLAAAPLEIAAPAGPPPGEWTGDPGAAAACAAILERMELEFAAHEPVAYPARRMRLATDVPRYVLFSVREMLFAVPIGRVLETDRMTPVTPLPGAAAGIKGLTNLRGEVVPVIDLREVLGWTSAEKPTARRMLVIQDGNRQPLAALLVDQVNGLAAFPATAWKSAEIAGAHAAEGFVEAVAERDREWVSRFNLDRVLNETHLPSLAA